MYYVYTRQQSGNNLLTKIRPLHDTYDTYGKHILNKCVITKEINKISSCVFDIYYNHPFYNSLYLMTSWVFVKNTKSNRSGFDFVGRVLKITESMDDNGLLYKSVVCESVLAFLKDTIQPYTPETLYDGDENTTGLKEFIDVVITNHNNQVEIPKRIIVGDINVNTHETNNNVYKGLNYDTTYDTLFDKLVDVFGGEMSVDVDDNCNLYLNYKTELNGNQSTSIELTKNMKSVSQTSNGSEIITHIIPLGCKLKDENNNETDERLTVASVNDGSIIITAGEDIRYGNIVKTVIFNDVTTPSILYQKGLDYMAETTGIILDMGVDTLNLWELGLQANEFILGDYTKIIHPLLNISRWYKINKMSIDCVNPTETTISLEHSKQTFSDVLHDMQKETRKLDIDIGNIQTDVYNNNVNIQDVDNKYNTITDTIIETTSQLEQTTSSISGRVTQTETDIGTLQTTTTQMSTALEMNAQGVSMRFETVNNVITNLDDGLQTEINNRVKCIDFIDGSINLNNTESPLTLTIDNDKLAFRKNGVVVSEWNAEQDIFNVGNINVRTNEKAQFGQFAFVPQRNGALSFVRLDTI